MISAHLSLDTAWSVFMALNSDHRPIIILLRGDTPSKSVPRSFTNFKKADWEGYREESEQAILRLPLPLTCAVGAGVLQRVLLTAAKHHIPSGRRNNLIPKLSDEEKLSSSAG